MIEGIGPDAELEVNANGGKQSKAIGAFHLVDPDFLYGFFDEYFYEAGAVVDFMQGGDKDLLIQRVFEDTRVHGTRSEKLIQIAKVLQEGAEKYSPNNWRLIPQEDHLNHAIAHLVALEAGDNQDDHWGHFLTRIMMVYATEPSKGFSYTRYIKDEAS